MNDGFALRVWIVVLGMFFMACRHAEDPQTPGKAGQIARAVEMLRLSSNHDKRLWLNRLRSLPCGGTDICQLQETCSKAYDDYLRALDSIESARRNLMPPTEDAMSPDASVEAVLSAAALAQSAQRLLMKSRQTMRQCAENEAVIRQRYKLR